MERHHNGTERRSEATQRPPLPVPPALASDLRRRTEPTTEGVDQAPRDDREAPAAKKAVAAALFQLKTTFKQPPTPTDYEGKQPKMSGTSERDEHAYRDFSLFTPDASLDEIVKFEKLLGATTGKHRRAVYSNFPAKLHQILSTDKFSDIITWLPHGRSWRVVDREGLMEKIVPGFFAQSNFRSFTQQVRSWGFKRLRQGSNKDSYYHEAFLRGMPHLTKYLKKVSVTRCFPESLQEPDLLKISEKFPLPEKPLSRSQSNSSTFSKGSTYTLPSSELAMDIPSGLSNPPLRKTATQSQDGSSYQQGGATFCNSLQSALLISLKGVQQQKNSKEKNCVARFRNDDVVLDKNPSVQEEKMTPLQEGNTCSYAKNQKRMVPPPPIPCADVNTGSLGHEKKSFQGITRQEEKRKEEIKASGVEHLPPNYISFQPECCDRSFPIDVPVMTSLWQKQQAILLQMMLSSN